MIELTPEHKDRLKAPKWVTEETHELEGWSIRYQRSKRHGIKIRIMKISGRMVFGVGSGLKEGEVHLLG